jgi:hypothetical protein
VKALALTILLIGSAWLLEDTLDLTIKLMIPVVMTAKRKEDK